MSKIMGICHLCGKYTELTFEHVPPKSANNKDRAKLITGREIFNVKKLRTGKSLRYINQPKFDSKKMEIHTFDLVISTKSGV